MASASTSWTGASSLPSSSTGARRGARSRPRSRRSESTVARRGQQLLDSGVVGVTGRSTTSGAGSASRCRCGCAAARARSTLVAEALAALPVTRFVTVVTGSADVAAEFVVAGHRDVTARAGRRAAAARRHRGDRVDGRRAQVLGDGGVGHRAARRRTPSRCCVPAACSRRTVSGTSPSGSPSRSSRSPGCSPPTAGRRYAQIAAAVGSASRRRRGGSSRCPARVPAFPHPLRQRR